MEWRCIVEWSCSLFGVVRAVSAFLLYDYTPPRVYYRKKDFQYRAQKVCHVHCATDDSFLVQFAEDKTSMPFSHFKVHN
jgi:hypothetical protein